LLAFDSILLVIEREAGTCKGGDELAFREGQSVFVMQRCVEGGVDSVMYCEGDIAETKGLAPGFSCGGVEVFGRAEQPEEGEDDELDGLQLEVAQDWVVNVEDREELADDGDVDRVGSGCRIIVSFHGSVEISEYGMELSCFWVDLRIWAVHVGEPLGDGRDGLTNCARSDRLTLLASFAVSQAKDQEVAEDVFRKQGMEGAGLAFACAEVSPDDKDLVGSIPALCGCGCRGNTERSAEIAAKRFLVGVVAVAMVWAADIPVGSGQGRWSL
jgi:hypothetical protein